MRNIFEYQKARAKEDGVGEAFSADWEKDKNEEAKAYKEGKTPLDFKFQFSSGEIFRASEDESGIASMVIERNGEVIMDFGILLHSKLKLVTPKYLLKLPTNTPKSRDLRAHRGSFWFSNGFYFQDSLISVGLFTDLRGMLATLHEIGHARRDLADTSLNRENLRKLQENEPSTTDKYNAQETSISERMAWAGALKILRAIQQKYNINMVEAFGGVGKIQEFIDINLRYHRYVAETNLHPGIKGLCKLILEQAPTPEDLEFLSKLFDKKAKNKPQQQIK